MLVARQASEGSRGSLQPAPLATCFKSRMFEDTINIVGKPANDKIIRAHSATRVSALGIKNVVSIHRRGQSYTSQVVDSSGHQAAGWWSKFRLSSTYCFYFIAGYSAAFLTLGIAANQSKYVG